jgi:hypothetical protein
MQEAEQQDPAPFVALDVELRLNLEEDHQSQGGKDLLPLRQTIQILSKNDAT